MATRKKAKTKAKAKKKAKHNYVVVTSRSYGKALRGVQIHFEGKRPSTLRDDGSITFGKHILEALTSKFKKFQWIITEKTDSISTTYGIVRVRTSQQLLERMRKENWARSRDIKNDIVQRFFSATFSDHFSSSSTSVYVPGTLAYIVGPDIVPRLSIKDKEALSAFLPNYVAAEAVGTVQKLKATAQIESLKSLARNLKTEIGRSHPEAWWQIYVKSNILLMQQGYIKTLEKLNVAIGDTKFPDFTLVTHDNYLDILEIKKPDTNLLKHDSSRGNYFWDTEVSKAISQTENYIEQINNKANDLRSYLIDKESINVKVVRPRGIILAGNTQKFDKQKERDDFRLLAQGLKNITILTYDELHIRLENYITVLKQFTAQIPTKRLGTRKNTPIAIPRGRRK